MKKADREKALQHVGRGYFGDDEIIRWITHLSVRGYYSCLWRHKSEGLWKNGGTYKVNDFPFGKEVAVPQKGESYCVAGANGTSLLRTL